MMLSIAKKREVGGFSRLARLGHVWGLGLITFVQPCEKHSIPYLPENLKSPSIAFEF